MKSGKPFWPSLVCGFLALAVLVSCGGSRSSTSSPPPTPNNTQIIAANAGPNNNYANGVFTSVTVCAPGSSNCQTISGLLVDTGSFGLRVLSSALGTLNGSLPQQKDASGNTVAECAQFVGNVIWGPVKTADVQIAGEKANSVPIQVIDASTFPVPSACTSLGPAQEDLTSLGANGILGVGFFIQDCGTACTATGSSNPGFYYSCSGSNCQITAESTSQQVQNPVALFSTDNNGVVVHLASTTTSVASLSGSLIFGIATESNNALGSAQVFVPDNSGNFSTTFQGKKYPGFIDSGSNAYFFLDSNTTGIPVCSNLRGLYCPSSPVNLSATNTGTGTSTSSNVVNFTIDNASQLLSLPGNSVFPTLGGPNATVFDWGLPFFFGRTVFLAIEGRQTPAGQGPFFAY